jgi:hypothetical protein
VTANSRSGRSSGRGAITRKIPRLAGLASLLLLRPPAALGLVDDEASNVPHVAASNGGRCYAKAVPDSLYGQAGRTRVYWVRARADSLLATYQWFSQRIFLECNVAAGDGPVSLSVVRFGPWPRGQEATARDLALAFYRGSRLLRRYSTLDIAGRRTNVSLSESHYTVIDSVLGYRWVTGNQYRFEVRTTDGRILSFDAATGDK